MKKRNNAFDLLCGICIIRMMMLHITQMCAFDSSPLWMEIMHWSYYFMCFFFFKAGYFNKSVSGKSVAYIKDKAKRLMVPWLTWGLIGNLVYGGFCLFLLNERNTYVQDLKWEHIWMSGMFYGNGPLWFLITFFTAYVMIHFIEKVKHLDWIILLFPAISWWLWKQNNPCFLDLDNVFMGVFFFFLGHLWHILLDKIGKRNGLILSVVFTLAFIAINMQTDVSYIMSSNKWFGNPLILIPCLVLSLCGISGILLLVNIPRIPVLCYIGQHSMVFFVAHWPIMMFYKMIKSGYVRTTRGHVDDYVLMILLIFSICFWIVPYVEKVPWLSGRFNTKKAQA